MFKSNTNSRLSLAKELSMLYDEICLVSEQMRSCNSDFIQMAHENFEEDEKYKSFRIAVLATCLTKIEEGNRLSDYLKELDVLREKLSENAHAVIDKYSESNDPWEDMRRDLGEEKYYEVLEDFYYDHFLIAQRFVLGSWLAKKRGDPLYMWKGLE